MSAERIVCLVPSLTETLVDFGLLDRLVGRTRYCTEPSSEIDPVQIVGGTKNPDIEAVVALAPDLVVMNAEENRLEDYEALAAAGLTVHVTHPRTVVEAAAMLGDLGRVTGADAAGRRLEQASLAALAEISQSDSVRRRTPVFCPIWRNPWMTFHRRTYVGDVLAAVGLENVFGGETERGADFFAVELETVAERSPQLVLLPDEPYVFAAEHAQELADLNIGTLHRLIDGKDLSWYGPRLPAALRRLAALMAPK
jgi:ABC-type Fe3+-hydroxamate transport system substrate-binding protein